MSFERPSNYHQHPQSSTSNGIYKFQSNELNVSCINLEQYETNPILLPFCWDQSIVALNVPKWQYGSHSKERIVECARCYNDRVFCWIFFGVVVFWCFYCWQTTQHFGNHIHPLQTFCIKSQTINNKQFNLHILYLPLTLCRSYWCIGKCIQLRERKKNIPHNSKYRCDNTFLVCVIGLKHNVCGCYTGIGNTWKYTFIYVP